MSPCCPAIGDPDYTGPPHEMQRVHAVGRRYAPRADGEGNMPSGRGSERTRAEVPTPSTPNHGASSSPDVSDQHQQSFPLLPLLLELLHVPMLEIDDSFKPTNQYQSTELLYQIEGIQEPQRRLPSKIYRGQRFLKESGGMQTGRSQPPAQPWDFRCCLNTAVPQSAKISRLIGPLFTSPAGATASSGPTSGGPWPINPSETCSRN
ncbi:hypothetical protein BS47DRAFT_1364500 [Hydnum rufescens UP504]|uniref:Uncharacterized protein n=1 Tax=Hydnum rufescens UP504 TaxID=1448309 RepID=A0A9P6DTE8_9AGAM|nr:hypothetical protein BS47DRAFT_1364500 [Hydnum rufescens UP504]